MAGKRHQNGRAWTSFFAAGVAMTGLLVHPSSIHAQDSSLLELRQASSNASERRGREDAAMTRERDRAPLGQSRSPFTRDSEALTPSERELLRELYQEGETVDRLDSEEYGRPEPEEPETKTKTFDIFAGPGDAADTLDPYQTQSPVAPVEAIAPGGLDEDDDTPLAVEDYETEAAYPSLRSAAEPVGRVDEDRVDEDRANDEFGNPPLAAGVAGETLSTNSLLNSNSRARTVESIIRPALQDKPFAPVGLRAGTLTIYPELYQGAGVTTNIDRRAGGESGAFSQTDLKVRALTNWSRHEGELNGRLAYRRDFGGFGDPNNPEAALDGRLRLDLGALTSATMRGAIAYRRDDDIDLGSALGSVRPEILSGSIGAELSHEIARTTLTGGVTLAREHYLSTIAGTRDQSYTTATATARAAFGVSPAIKPFIETSLGRRILDEQGEIDADATIPSLRAGLQLDLAEKIRGEVAAGYAWSIPEQGATSSAPTIDANLTWSPRRGTDLVFAARTVFEPEDVGGSTANYEASIALIHSLNARLDLEGTLTAALERNDTAARDPLSLAAEVGFTYWLNRTLALSGSYDYEKSFEAVPSQDWSANTVTVGLRIQR
ncbi:outer membrane beta-barrel protein [Fulvimarina sp. MAC3]|uniref:outer membrane beta-barrel protein n=1 Tax=Fulvimarina sp. MAC3 TaxID=3148887 RepID=UPI0031FDEF58